MSSGSTQESLGVCSRPDQTLTGKSTWYRGAYKLYAITNNDTADLWLSFSNLKLYHGDAGPLWSITALLRALNHGHGLSSVPIVRKRY